MVWVIAHKENLTDPELCVSVLGSTIQYESGIHVTLSGRCGTYAKTAESERRTRARTAAESVW